MQVYPCKILFHEVGFSDSIHKIRAVFDEETIIVYQAYNDVIANAALKAQTFVPPFKRERMTWIKPSFLWMANRSGWASKPGQERVLAIKIKRSGFEWALDNSSLSQSKDRTMPVRIQWDPERDIRLEKLHIRSIQIGLSNEAVEKYVNEWIVQIDDVTSLMKEIGEYVGNEDFDQAQAKLPKENVYPYQ